MVVETLLVWKAFDNKFALHVCYFFCSIRLILPSFDEFHQLLLWWQEFDNLWLYLVCCLIGSNTHWLEEVLHDVVDVRFVHVLAENNADRCVFVFSAVIVVEDAQVTAELGEVCHLRIVSDSLSWVLAISAIVIADLSVNSPIVIGELRSMKFHA